MSKKPKVITIYKQISFGDTDAELENDELLENKQEELTEQKELLNKLTNLRRFN